MLACKCQRVPCFAFSGILLSKFDKKFKATQKDTRETDKFTKNMKKKSGKKVAKLFVWQTWNHFNRF